MAKSKGLGDDLKKVFDATGITKVVETVTDALGIEDCNCSGRQTTLNKWIPYNNTESYVPQSIEQNIDDFTVGIYIFNNDLTITIGGVMNNYRIGDKIYLEEDNPSFSDFKQLYSIGIISKG